MADEIEIAPLTRPVSISIRAPGSKSITNRALLLAVMAKGRSVIEALQLGDDAQSMVGALRQLGFRVEIDRAARRALVDGGGGRIPSPGADLDVGGAGTAMRFLTAFLTLSQGRFRIDGNLRMRQRPIGELLDALQRLGATIYSERHNRCPPVVVEASRSPFAGGTTEIDARASSQFVSALLMPAPLWPQGLRLRVLGDSARPFIDMTLRIMAEWGAVSTVEDAATIVVPGGQTYAPRRFTVEPDASAASYFAAAAALCGGAARLEGLDAGSLQGDLGFVRVLERMGARVTWRADSVEVEGSGYLAGVDVAMNAMPDMVATLAAIAPFATSPTRIRNVGFIRFHESDRLHALATELHRLGASVAEQDDGLLIAPSRLHGAAVETYDDHRIAMSFAVTGLKLAGVRIKNPGCAAKTFPGFFDHLAALARPGRIECA